MDKSSFVRETTGHSGMLEVMYDNFAATSGIIRNNHDLGFIFLHTFAIS